MGSASRRKGKAGELEVRRVFRAHGFDVDRVPNSGGLRIKGDLHGDCPVHVEVKRTERTNVPAAYRQATGDCDSEHWPVVAHRANLMPWLATLELELLVELLEVLGALEQAGAIAETYIEVDGCARIVELAGAADRMRARLAGAAAGG